MFRLHTGVKGKRECPPWEKAAAGLSAAHCKIEEGAQGPVPAREGLSNHQPEL